MSSTDPPAQPPLPAPDAVTQFFWDAVDRHELMIQRCKSCGHYIHYPKIICRFCQSRERPLGRLSRMAPGATNS